MHCTRFFATLGCSLLLGFPSWAMSPGPWNTPHTQKIHFVTHDSDEFHANGPWPNGNPQGTRPLVHPVPPPGPHGIDATHWREGHWWRGDHYGRFGWWWIVGPDFYEYPSAVAAYPAPPLPVQGFWYWCDAYQQYYPYVAVCPTGWRPVQPGAPIG
jgi:hypothetical protein